MKSILKEPDIKRFIKLLAKGLSFRDIAIKIGCAHHMDIPNRLKRHGYEINRALDLKKVKKTHPNTRTRLTTNDISWITIKLRTGNTLTEIYEENDYGYSSFANFSRALSLIGYKVIRKGYLVKRKG